MLMMVNYSKSRKYKQNQNGLFLIINRRLHLILKKVKPSIILQFFYVFVMLLT